jgi:hypothetical protein
MSISNVRTLKCDGPECNKSLSFDITQQKETFDNPANAWLKAIRVVQTIDQREFVYCNDVCEIMGAKSGQHNLPQAKAIIDSANTAQIQAAAAAADAARKSTENLKTGQGGPVLVQG